MTVHMCMLRLHATYPRIYPRGVVRMKNSFYQEHAWFFTKPKFWMFDTTLESSHKVRVLTWVNSATEEPFRYLNINTLVEEYQLEADESILLWLNDVTQELSFTVLKADGKLKYQPLIEGNSSEDDSVVELVHVMRPHHRLRIDENGLRKQAIPKTFIESAGLQDAETLHLKPQGSNKRWMVEFTKRRPKSWIYEMKEGWEEFVADNRLVLGEKYWVYSKADDKHTLVFEINDAHPE